ncbi:MAG: hypothetical protein HRT38_20450 [Alteromonadaceae bacterium]|nr:hypothetical protein [Alteromonadaceae bacterium]
MAIIKKIEHINGLFIVQCPGCKIIHHKHTQGNSAKWTFNGYMEKPTLTPSLFLNNGQLNPIQPNCHSINCNGFWRWLTDCSYEFIRRQKVPMINIE